MRLWSLHPQYLDSKGLIALWREGLLAQKVLLGKTRGYKNHPQLNRFKNTGNPAGRLGNYLQYISHEANFNRGYNFDTDKIVNRHNNNYGFTVTTGQLKYEFRHLLKKLQKRDYDRYEMLKNVSDIKAHPVFVVVDGDIEEWEILP